YAVWVSRLSPGAGGAVAANTDKGVNLTLEVDSPAGETAAKIVEKLAGSEAAPADLSGPHQVPGGAQLAQADLSVSNEGTAGATFGGPKGAFMVNWTYIWTNYDATQPEVKKDLGFTRYPESA